MMLLAQELGLRATRVAMFLADGTTPTQNGGRGADFGKASPVALVVLILLLIGVAFLGKSMTKHLKRVPASFDETEPDAGAGSADADSGGESVQQNTPRADSDAEARSEPGG
ncbi:MAG: hypothetical protein ACRDQ1_14700 [Sciscionella sp.]